MVNRLSNLRRFFAATLVLPLLLYGCGGKDNLDPSVTIRASSPLIEKTEATLNADARDADGQIVSYQWEQVSGPDLTFADTTSDTLVFTPPELTEDTRASVKVTVADDKGATVSNTYSFTIKRITKSVELSALVTDEPLPGATIIATIGDLSFSTESDDQGSYTLLIEVDDSYAGKLVLIVARGNSDTHPGVVLVAQLPSLESLISMSGDDTTLTGEEMSGINITNVTTAELILIERANGNNPVENEAALEQLKSALIAEDKIRLAAAIKILIDNDNFTLPDGVEDTLSLFKDETQTNEFIDQIEAEAPGLLSQIILLILNDPILIGDEDPNDFDGDGVPNAEDAFPFNPTESVDTDGDGIGNNADPDDDNDGVPDEEDAFPLDETESVDTDGDGIGNNADPDDDNDGVPDAEDAFPLDDTESVDTDGDGIGNNADPDDDNDGVPDSEDAFPLDETESVDTDGDGIGNNADDDDDNDGVPDAQDAFPLDATESVDTDGDGIGNNADPDDDNDGVPDGDDAFPFDSSESVDTDGDGIGNNADTDDDDDGVLDEDDAFPLDENESVDTDGDGIGNNADTDDDDDGVLDVNDAYPLISLGDLPDTDGDGIPDDCDATCQALGMMADDDDDGNGIPDDEEGNPVEIVINTPESLITVGTSPVTVSGTVTEGATVFLNGVEVDNTDGTFEGDVTLQEGSNSIEARAVLNNNIQTDLITISLDKTPPYLTVDSHQDNQTVYESSITITGLVNDIVRGTIEESQANVLVNGTTASIKNRSYSASGISLNEGANTITIEGSDQVGNTDSISLTINYEVLVGNKIQIVSGQAQEGKINEILSSALSVKVSDQDDAPLQGESVVFRVAQGSGAVGASTDAEGRAVIVETDENGLAATPFKLGARAGVNNHKVTASVVGITGSVSFVASAQGEVGNKLSVNSGNNQRGVAKNNLPEPFVAVVTDDGANVVSGARVRFVTATGDGVFANGEPEITVETDSDGRATAQFKLGSKTGLDSQRVTATLLDGPAGQTIAAGFTASAFKPEDSGNTSIKGVVMDNQDTPIPNVTVRIEDTTREAVTDENGQFIITEAPVGPVHLIADGSTVTDGKEYPSLSYNLVTISGIENPLSAPIYMVALDTENAVFAGPTDVTLEMASYPGFKMEIAKDSVTFPDGAKEGLISVTSVNASKVPMSPPNGMQPQFIVTIQPTGAMFNPPARLTLPNVDAHPAGAQVEMYSYDHDLEEFVSIGLGTASEDGSVIRSNQGVGVIKAGWHCGSQPTGSGCCGGGGGGNGGCPTCQKRDGNNCEDGSCKADDSQDPGNCKKCSGGSAVNDDSKKPTGQDGPCQKCQGGDAVADSSKNDAKCGTGDKQACYTCKDGKCGNHCTADPDKTTRTLTSGDIGGLDSVAKKLKDAGKFLPGPIEVTDASASLSVSGTWESGEKCCKECSDGKPLKSEYEKLQGDYKIEASVKIGIKGFSNDLSEILPLSYTRVVLAWEIGPFLTIKGSLGNSISYDISDCEEGNCLTVGVAGSLGAQLDVGGSIKIGYDRFDVGKCPTKNPAIEAEKKDTECFGGFKGGSGEAWASGGSALKAEIAVSDCPGGDKCEVGLDKVAGKVFVKASVDLGFFKYEYENVLAEGTLFEGATASCL